MSYPAGPPPAGWYDDPNGAAYLRWWNGIEWADQTKPYALDTGAQTAPVPPPWLAQGPAYATDPQPTLPYPGATVEPYRPSSPAVSVKSYAAGYAPAPIGAWRSPADDRPIIRGMGDAIHVVFQKYATFTGRATRSEYWFWILFYALTALVLVIPYLGAFAWAIWALTVYIPTLAVTVRRLRDAGLHWAFLFIGLVPFGGIVLLVLLCQPSKHP